MHMPGNFHLIKPQQKYLLSYLELCRKSFHAVHNTYLLHDPEKFGEWQNTVFQRYAMDEAGIELPQGYLPSCTFWALYGEEVAGVVNIRKGLNDALRDYGGNVGFMLNAAFRKRKLSFPLLELALAKAKELGVSPILMTCMDENLPSLYTLKKAAAEKVESAVTWADGKYCPIHRFWF